MKRTMAVMLAAIMCGSFLACGSTSASADEQLGLTAKAGEYTLHAAKDYSEILKLLESSGNRGGVYTGGGIVRNGMFEGVSSSNAADTAQAPAAAATDGKGSTDAPAGESVDYSGTNVQVAGIDEGDIVKTDGKYLYVMDKDSNVRIVKADGENTATVGKIDAEENVWSSELFVDGDTLVILATENRSSADNKDGTRTVAEFYNIGDRSAPVKTGELGQDGYYSTARLLDGKLYIVSNMSFWYWIENGVTPAARQFAPCLYDNGKETVMPADCILLPPETNDQSYTVLTSADLESGTRIGEQAVLGRRATVYMNDKNIYLATDNYSETKSDPYTADQYSVVDYTGCTNTALTRFSIDEGKLALAASGSIPGTMINQFAMDEKDGHLRVVTTINQYSWSIYTDSKYDFENYKSGDSLNSSALYILDGDLKTTGSVEDLAPGERVYSVRFDGDTGYFVTYKQIDPLFAVDLSDPTSPKVLSELKIPGFSQYLHVWGDGELFGLGQNTTGDDGTVSDGLKLSMFNTTNPADVTEITTLKLDGNWSAAQYNHKAILILPDKNIIAFPMDNCYAIYSYGSGGFTERAEMDMGDLWTDNVRGVQIGDMFYVCASNGVGVYSLSDFITVASVIF